ncbi:putative phage abortive infection protein [Enterobacter asburiae]
MNRTILLLLPLLVLASILIFFLLVVYGIGSKALLSVELTNPKFGEYLAALGTFGDFVGGLTNPIIGMVGFLALMFTITLQIRQNKQTSEQSYESSIFNLINLQNNIIENLEYNDNKKRSAFSEFLDEHKEDFNGVDKNTVMRPHHTYSLARISYESFNNNSNEVFGHYFRNLYTILKTIDELPECFNRKKYYSRIVRSQLSMSELTVLFLNYLFKVCDDGKFAELLIKYQMLEHLKVTSISNPKSALDIEPRKLDYKIGDKATVSIYEMAYYMYGEKKFSANNFASEETTHGAFGKNRANCLNQIQEMVLVQPTNTITVYGDRSSKPNLLNRFILKIKWATYKWKLNKLVRKKPF